MKIVGALNEVRWKNKKRGEGICHLGEWDVTLTAKKWCDVMEGDFSGWKVYRIKGDVSELKVSVGDDEQSWLSWIKAG